MKPSPTEFTEETEIPRQALADGDVPLQAAASVTTLAALRELCKRRRGSFPCIVGPGQPSGRAGASWGSSGPTAASPQGMAPPQRSGPQLSPRALNGLCQGCFPLGMGNCSCRASPEGQHPAGETPGTHCRGSPARRSPPGSRRHSPAPAPGNCPRSGRGWRGRRRVPGGHLRGEGR